MNENREGFTYTYSASEQSEIRNIREKYAPKEESKLERLRRLDRAVLQKAQIISLTLGIIGTLVLGFGMSLAISELNVSLGMSTDMGLIIGIPVGILGGIIASLAYPAYNKIVKIERKKIAPEIIRLTDELMK